MFTEVLVTLLVVGAGLLVYKMHVSSCRAQELAYEKSLAQVTKLTQSLIVLRGLNPHVVDPKTFGPSGMSREDEERQAAQAGKAQEEMLTAEEQALREAENEFFRRRDEMMRLAAEETAGGGLPVEKPYSA